MSKRKKKSPLRDEFTDALNEEISERKIIERTQPKEEVFQKTITLEKAVEVEKISVEPVKIAPVEKIETAPEIKTEEITAPQIVEVKVDKKLEERILKEADDDFYNEKPAENNVDVEKPPRKSIYHSKTLREWEEEQREGNKKIPPPISETPKVEQPHKLSHAEKFGVVASVAMLVYAFVNLDKPLFFLALSLFVHLLSVPVSAISGKHSAAVQNSLRSFSIVVFFGALLFLFM